MTDAASRNIVVIMPRYYFDVVDGEIAVQDPKGPELENIKRAEAKAQKILTEVAEVTFSDADRRDVTTIVGDEAGRVLRMRLSSVVERFSDGSTANTSCISLTSTQSHD